MIPLKYTIKEDGTITVSKFRPYLYNAAVDGAEYYIYCWKLIFEIKRVLSEIKIDPSLAGNYEFDVLIHHANDFRGNVSHERTERFIKDGTKRYYMYGQEQFISGIYSPILHFCRMSFEEPRAKRYAAVVDSSIWNFFIKLDKDVTTTQVSFDAKNKKQLKKAIEDITYNIKNGLYDLDVAKEYAEFNARKTRESHLKFDSHGVHVSPFVFHSESKILSKLTDDADNKTIIDRIFNYKWRILLVDDKANSPMPPYKSLSDASLVSKVKIIESRLKKMFEGIKSRPYQENYDTHLDCNLLIEYVENLSEAKKALKNRKYDFILLDYLLGENEYGYKLLREIENHKNDYIIGPRDCLFFMFMSAYPSAVHERLLAEGLNLNEEYWHISVGACPTNTPQLFMYNLIKLMDRRLDRSGINKLSADEIIQGVNNIYDPDNSKYENQTVRERASSKYREVLSLQYHYQRMLKDVEYPTNGKDIFSIKGSVLITDFVQKNEYLGGMLEHLTQMIHLTAFGTTRQWSDIWEEYLYFRDMFDGYISSHDVSQETKDMFMSACGFIRQHVMNLKKEQR